MKTHSIKIALALVTLLAAHLSLHAQVPVLTDSFNNGVVADSDHAPAVWTPTYQPANTVTVETGGAMVLTAGGAASPNGTLSARIGMGTLDQRLNFFRREIRCVLDLSIGGTAPGGQNRGQFSFCGANSTTYSVEDAFVIQISADNLVNVAAKMNKPSTTASAINTLASANVGSSITGLDLTINATHFTLVVSHTGGSGSTTLTGPHGLFEAQWAVDGASVLGFDIIRATGGAGGAGLDTVMTVNDLAVTWTQPTGALFEDAFGNSVPEDSDLTTGFWTPSLPNNSTVTENGKLVQVVATASEGTFNASHISAVTPSFNFFDQQLSIQAELSVTGDTAATWMTRGRLLLSSTTANGNDGPDNLMVGFRNSNSLSFNQKINAPYVRPDNGANAQVTELLGGETVVYSGSDRANAFNLTLNDSRYQLRFLNGGKASGILRFSGEHGIPRAEWGANGDSALLLETMRTSAAAGTSAISTWDNVTVTPDSSTLLSESYKHFQVTNESLVRDYTIWLPSTEGIIRGVILLAPGSGEDFRYMVHDAVAQEAARSIGFALVGYKNDNNMYIWQNDSARARQGVQAMLDAAAAATARPEIANAPLCITGLSAGGYESSHLAWHWPERLITYVPHRGGEIAASGKPAATKKVPGFFIGGGLDTNALTNPFKLQNAVKLLRGDGWNVAFALDTGSGHTINGNQGWEAGLAWIVEVVNLRYPRPAAPSPAPGAGWPTLTELSNDDAWLGRSPKLSAATTRVFDANTAFEPISPIASYSASPINESSWLPNETCARLFRALSSADGVTNRTVSPKQTAPRIVRPAQYADPVALGQTVTIDLDPREFGITNTVTQVEFYDGATLLGTDTTGPEWSHSYTPASVGLHAITLVVLDNAGNQRSALRPFMVTPADYPPVSHAQVHSFSSDTQFNGTLTGSDPEGGTVTFTIVSAPQHGQLLNFNAATGAFTYLADTGYSGADSFSFASVNGAVTGPSASVSLTVTSSQAAGVLGFTATTMKVNKTAGLATLTVSRTGQTQGAVSISYATSDSSATAGTHYTAASGTLNWADGDAAQKTFTVPITNTASPQLPRQFKVTLSNPTGGALLSAATDIAVLIEDPSATLNDGWSQTLIGTLTDSSPAVSAEGVLGTATIGGSSMVAGPIADHGNFIHQSHTGDGVLTAYVPASTPAQAAARFGVMVRETPSSDSRMVGTITSGDPVNYGAKQIRRTATGTSGTATVTPTTHNNHSTPRWVRLIRIGSNFTSQSSTNGTTWDYVGQINLSSIPATASWGLFHTSADLDPITALGDYQLAVFENVSLTPLPIPATPTGLTVTFSPSPNRNFMICDTDDFASHYRFERRTEISGYTQIADITQKAFNDFTAALDSAYEYRVQAYNGSGSSPWSAGVKITTPPTDPQLPVRPSFLTVTPAAGSDLALQWLDNSADETSFTLERRAAHGQFALLQTLAANAITFTDSTTQPGLVYDYRIRATNANGNSAWTPAVSGTAPGTASGYQQWLLANSLPMDASGDGSATATPADDGLANLIKYGLGLLPTANGNGGRLDFGTTTVGADHYITFTYTRPEPAPSDITYTVEASGDLTASSWSSTGLVEVSSTVNANLRTITIRDHVPISGTNHRFMRLSISQP